MAYLFKMQLWILTLVLASEVGWAQQESVATGPRRQMATIIYSGLGGAVLGLSTLSFYGRPQEKLSNIAIGFALGIIAGTTYVTYQAATNPNQFYSSKLPESLQVVQVTQPPEASFEYSWSF
jgi:hypothetical protein